MTMPKGGDPPQGWQQTADLPEIEPAFLENGPLKGALEHWLALRPAGQDLPPAAALDMAVIPDRVLRHLAICTGFQPDGRLAAVFAGSVAAMFAGGSPEGRMLDELYPPQIYPAILGVMRRVDALRRPLFVQQVFGLDGVMHLVVRRLALPLQDRQGRVSLIAVAVVYNPTAEGRRIRFKLFRPGLTLMSEWFAAIRL